MLLAWCLGALVVSLSLAARPARAAGELVVEGVRTDAYPRVALRFVVRPGAGSAPADLSSRQVAILDAERPQRSVDVYAVGRAPDGQVDTYEATWLVPAPAEAGQRVRGRLVVTMPNREELTAEFGYLAPSVARARPAPAPAPDTTGGDGGTAPPPKR